MEFKTPCGCILAGFLEPCDCREFCRCELQVRLCKCEWPIEALDALGNMLSRLDPKSYADGPSPETSPLVLTKRSIRVTFRESRFDCGYSIWHPSDRVSDDLKNGGALSRTANGEDVFGPTLPRLTHRCYYCGDVCDGEGDRAVCPECKTARKRTPGPISLLKEAV